MALDLQIINQGLKVPVENYDALEHVGLLPNIPTKTLGDEQAIMSFYENIKGLRRRG